jgi:S1-C subfamily serine protease
MMNFSARRGKFIKILVALALVCLRAEYSWALTEDEKNNITVYREASKGVVNITSIVMERDFFQGIVPREGAGSGSVIDTNGYILTNNHVIKDARRIEVTLYDGTKWSGRLVGTDPDNDVAVIRIDAPKQKLHPLPLGNSNDLEIGQKVLAIGNPFGLSETLTTGIISSLGRSIRSRNSSLMEDLIQTDAAINPGNSGGPLLDSKGKIIGVNTAIFSPTGASVGIGFAIPVNTVKQIVPDLIKKGYVSYAWLGVTIFPVTPWVAKALELSVDHGALVIELTTGGPAERAGLRGSDRRIQLGNVILPVGGDIILAMDGNEIKSYEELGRMIRKHEPGDRITLKILRGLDVEKIRVTLGEKPMSK